MLCYALVVSTIGDYGCDCLVYHDPGLRLKRNVVTVRKSEWYSVEWSSSMLDAVIEARFTRSTLPRPFGVGDKCALFALFRSREGPSLRISKERLRTTGPRSDVVETLSVSAR